MQYTITLFLSYLNEFFICILKQFKLGQLQYPMFQFSYYYHSSIMRKTQNSSSFNNFQQLLHKKIRMVRQSEPLLPNYDKPQYKIFNQPNTPSTRNKKSLKQFQLPQNQTFQFDSSPAYNNNRFLNTEAVFQFNRISQKMDVHLQKSKSGQCSPRKENRAEIKKKGVNNSFQKIISPKIKNSIEVLKEVIAKHKLNKQSAYTSNKYNNLSCPENKINLENCCVQSFKQVYQPNINHLLKGNKIIKLKDTMSTQYSQKDNSLLKITEFEKIKELGKGKFGIVSLFRHKFTGMLFAIKIIDKNVIVEQGLVEQLVRQVKIQFYINNRHIVKLYSIFDDSKCVYLITEFCVDGQLYKFMQQNGKIPQNQTGFIVKDLCYGVQQLHKYGIIHRDLKPENVVLSYGMAKICDFGWSVASKNRMRQTFCGTPLYVSPQLLIGDNYNQKVDLWAIGIIAYEMLVGQIPFKITCERQLINIVKSQVIFPSFMSRQAKDFIKSLLQKNPKNRKSILQILSSQFLTKYEGDSQKIIRRLQLQKKIVNSSEKSVLKLT